MSSQPPPSAWNGSQVNGSSSPGSNYSSHPNQPPQPQSRPTSSGQGSFNNGNSNNNNYSQQFPRQSQQLPPNNRHSSFNALDSQSSMNSRPNPSSPPPTTATTSNPQPDSHRRTQSMRPMSAFQPMDSVGPMSSSPSLGNGPNSSSFQRPSSPSGSLANSISRSTNQPLTFKSADLRAALALHEAQNSKIYMEGYLSRRDECASDGKPLHPNDDKRRWNLCFVQLSGTVMSVWSVKEMDKAAKEGREVPPSYINITDSFVDYVGSLTEDPAVVPGSRGRYENVFALNSAGANRMFFCVEGAVGRRLVQAWVNAIRLASWEKVRLEEIYTGALIRARLGAALPPGPGADPADLASAPPQPNVEEPSVKSPLIKGKMEGWVKARFMGSTEWKKAWLVISNERPNGLTDSHNGNNPTSPPLGSAGATSGDNESISGGTKKKFWKLGGAGDRSSILSLSGLSPNSSPSTSASTFEDLPLPPPPPGANDSNGTALFYESKKSKKPFAMMTYVRHVFAVYPSRAELVEGSSLCKVEGAFSFAPSAVKEGEFKIPRSATARLRETGWCMLMPESELGGSKGQNAEMMKWVVATMDCFGLYGRPNSFVWDARSPVSAFFAYPIGPYKDRLFLDRELAEFLDVREERHLASRSNLHGIMAARMRGERTPILPALPTPKGLSEVKKPENGPGVKNGNGAARGEDEDDDAPLGRPSAAGAPAPALPDFSGGLPPLDFGNSQDSKPNAAASQPGFGQQQRDASASNGTSTNDSAFARQLSSIGERSREGSTITAVDRASGHDRGESVASISAQQKPLPAVSNPIDESSTTSSAPPAQAQVQPPPVSQLAYAPSQRSVKAAPSIASESKGSVVSPQDSTSTQGFPASATSQQPAPGYQEKDVKSLPSLATNNGISSAGPTSAAPSDPSVYSQFSQGPTRNASIASQARSPAVLAPSGRGAEAEPASRSTNGGSNQLQRRESGSSYDEGALFYMNSISDQLPAPTPSQQQAVRSVPPPKQVQQPSTEPTIEERALSPVSSQSQSTNLEPQEPKQEPKLSPRTQETSIGDDALAAYSFLEKPPSPMIKQKSLSRSEHSGPESNSTSAHTSTTVDTTPASRPPAQAFPSSFVNKRAAERKEAAQANAQAHQDALSKPGRAAGKGKKNMGLKKGHAWGEESSEDEDDEEEEEEDEEEEIEQRERITPQRSRQPSEDATRSRSGSQTGASISGQPIVAPPQSMYGGYPQQMQQQLGMMNPQMMAAYGAGSQMGEFAEGGAPKPWANQFGSRDSSPQRGSTHPALRQSVFNSHLGVQHGGDDSRSSTPPSVAGRSPAGSIGAAQGRGTFINLKEEEQPGQMTAVFQPHGLLQAGAADKAERSAKHQEAEARSQGGHLVNVPNKPPPPQAGLLGAITAHERDRKAAGGYGATLTERERERVNAERRGREEEEQNRIQQQQMQQQMQQIAAMGMNPQMMGFNPYMWQQMQMQMYGMGGGMPGWGANPYAGSQMGMPQQQGGMDPMMAQQQAMMAAQQAYAQAMSQVGGHGPDGSVIAPPASMAPGGSPSTRPQSMAPSMMPGFMGGLQSPPMSFYGAPPMGGFPGYMQPPPGSEFGHGSPRGSYTSPQGGSGSPSVRPGGSRSREPSNQ